MLKLGCLGQAVFTSILFFSYPINDKDVKELDSDDEFEPHNTSSTDDEETIAQEETLEGTDGKKKTEREKEEIDALKRESEIPLEDLLDDLPPEYLETLGKAEKFSTVADEVSTCFVFPLRLRIYDTVLFNNQRNSVLQFSERN